MLKNPLMRIGRPFDEEEEKLIAGGDGEYLFDSNGRKYLDLCGGIWNTPFGYGNKYIIEKIKKQAEILPFCNLITSAADIQVSYAERLTRYLGMEKLLFTCSGSEAVEAAIKAARQYQSIKNSGKRAVAAFNLSYHGTSYGAMSVSGIDLSITAPFGPLLDGIEWIQTPQDIYDAVKWNREIERLFSEKAENLAGIIIEPVIASGGVIEVPDETLRYIERLCLENDVMLIYDEVSTGFGRTGVPFVFKDRGIKPDLVCLSKGMTNGYMPLGALAFSKRIAGTFIQAHETFEHFSSQSGNLISTAAADAVLDIMEDYDSYGVERKGECFRKVLAEELKDTGADVRGRGLMTGISLDQRLSDAAFKSIIDGIERQGILVYYFNNPGYNRGLSFFPPFTIEEETLIRAAHAVAKKIKREPEIMAMAHGNKIKRTA
ncbi:MAG TPA: aspartate aminotransferase family protein [Candidatus Alectryocaccobium stercorigallinarum]|nr:aspartate aminotransferase family protein [Candidatus Alectryocaccobium stercorigallinarum]